MDRTANLLGAMALLLADAVLADAARAAGRSGAAGAALAVLAQDPGLGIEQLRPPLGLSQSAAVRVVDSLVADGLAERGPGPDARSVAVRLTAAGDDQAQTVLRRRAALLEDSLAALSKTEREQLAVILEKILSRLTADRAQAERVCRLCDYSSCPQESCPVDQSACAWERGTSQTEAPT
ncbi:MAG TPA: MarR family winged helix-turn-helix transcriptional regulator [Kineosporiaceae bacterium]|nr:MarR family winged helix-turn-helix transcriptional regulator [Kineosporiaceae bacterium]